MASLRSVLLKYAGGTALPNSGLGGDDERDRKDANAPAINKDNLQRELAAINKENSRYFLICVIMVLILFLVSVGIVLTNLNEPDVIKIVLGAFGVSSAGLITMMIKLWREKSNVELLVLLAVNTDTDTLKTVVGVLAKR